MRGILVSIVCFFCCAAQAQTEIQFWHAMQGARAAELDALVKRFNDSQKEARVVAEPKGGYDQVMSAALAAQRAGGGPHLVQIYEVGTAQMMAAKGAVRTVAQVLYENGERIETKFFLPAVAGYFSDGNGQLIALPFNISTPILFYSKEAFRKAKLDPDKPPKTWYEMPKYMGALLESGLECAYTTVWPSWIQIENMGTWHKQDFASRENGLGGLDARLIFNTHLMVRHVSFLSSWARAGYFTYSGRALEGERRFAKGECAMLTASSSSLADLRREAEFEFAAAPLPHYDDIPGAPHHTMIGGAGLWVLSGKKAPEYRAAARFLAWLARPEVQAEWHQRTGYVPVTRAAYERTAQTGFYREHPGHEIAIKQLLLNQPTRESRGIRIGEFQAIRGILEEELEAVWDGKVEPKRALDQAAERGNELLRKFEAANRTGKEPVAPQKQAPRKATKQ